MTSVHNPHENIAVSKFARFFRSYGIALGIILAATPLASRWAGSLLPVYKSTRDVLTFSTSLISLLAVAILFGIRRSIGEAVFPPSRTRCISLSENRSRRMYALGGPIILATVAVFALMGYLLCLDLSVEKISPTGSYSMDQILSFTPLIEIPYLWELLLAYPMMFLSATMAFVWLGLVEYVQNEIGVSDADLITNAYTLMSKHEFKLDDQERGSESAPYFYLEFDPRVDRPSPTVSGPFCGRHQRRLAYTGKDEAMGHLWECINPDKRTDRHVLSFPYDTVDASVAARERANFLLKQLIGR